MLTKKRVREKISELEEQKKLVEAIDINAFKDWRIRNALKATKATAIIIAVSKISGMKELLAEM